MYIPRRHHCQRVGYMSATLKLLDKYKETRSIPSDNAAAIALGIHRATVSGWRRGGKQAEPHVVAAMAKAVGEEAGGWLALIESERARTEADRKTWAAVARQLGAAAAVAVVALLPVGNVQAGVTQVVELHSEFASNAYYVKSSQGPAWLPF